MTRLASAILRMDCLARLLGQYSIHHILHSDRSSICSWRLYPDGYVPNSSGINPRLQLDTTIKFVNANLILTLQNFKPLCPHCAIMWMLNILWTNEQLNRTSSWIYLPCDQCVDHSIDRHVFGFCVGVLDHASSAQGLVSGICCLSSYPSGTNRHHFSFFWNLLGLTSSLFIG